MRSPHLRRGLSSLAALLLVAACAPAGQVPLPVGVPVRGSVDEAFFGGVALPPAEGIRSHLGGSVSFGGPVVGATVRILDDQGQAIGPDMISGPGGAFSRPLEGLPTRFTVEAKGGKVGPQNLPMVLRAQVVQAHASSEPLCLSVASTIGAEAAKGQSAASEDYWVEAARLALGLPAGRALWKADRRLDVGKLEAQLKSAASPEAWVQSRAAELQKNQSFPTSYLLPNANRDANSVDKVAAGLMVGWVTQSILTGNPLEAGGKVLEKYAFGAIMKAAGLKEDPMAEVMARISELDEQLLQIKQDLELRVNAALNEELRAQYANTVSLNLRTLLMQQDRAMSRLEALGHRLPDPITHSTDFAATAKQIDKDINRAFFAPTGDALTIWSSLLNPDQALGNQNNLIRKMSQLTATGGDGKLWRWGQSQAIEAWWQSIDARMGYSAYLMAEHHIQNENVAGARATLTRWHDLRKACLTQLRGTTSRSDSFPTLPAYPSNAPNPFPGVASSTPAPSGPCSSFDIFCYRVASPSTPGESGRGLQQVFPGIRPEAAPTPAPTWALTQAPVLAREITPLAGFLPDANTVVHLTQNRMLRGMVSVYPYARAGNIANDLANINTQSGYTNWNLPTLAALRSLRDDLGGGTLDQTLALAGLPQGPGMALWTLDQVGHFVGRECSGVNCRAVDVYQGTVNAVLNANFDTINVTQDDPGFWAQNAVMGVMFARDIANAPVSYQP